MMSIRKTGSEWRAAMGIMQRLRFYIFPLVLLGTASAQLPADALRSKLAGVRYAPIAKAARVEGNVHVVIADGVVTLLSGPPLLVQTAVESTRSLGFVRPETNLDLTYHFVLVDTAAMVPTQLRVPRGNAFERIVLRILGLKTEKLSVEYRCQEAAAPANDLKITGTGIEIWIYGRLSCPMAETGTLVAKR